MIKLTVKQMPKKEEGFDVQVKAEDATTLEFFTGAVSLLRAYQKYCYDEHRDIISNRKLLKQTKKLLKKALEMEEK